jgi:Glycosyl transferases group 1
VERDRRVLLSVPWTSPWSQLSSVRLGDTEVTVVSRRNDFGAGPWRRFALTLMNLQAVVRASWTMERIVVCTSMMDVLVAAVFLRLRPHVQLVVWDFLMPTNPRLERIAYHALRRVDLWLVIRKGDADTFTERLGARRCMFVPFPAVAVDRESDGNAQTEPFVYAAGSAHRDWGTFVEATRQAGVRAVISTNDEIVLSSAAAEFVSVLPLTSPIEGRALMARAMAVCVPLVDTHLPSGPLVLLDAMGAGKPLITTDVNGTRDYVEPNVTALVARPGDVGDMKSALQAIATDRSLRERMGELGFQSVQKLEPRAVLQDVSLAGAPWRE